MRILRSDTALYTFGTVQRTEQDKRSSLEKIIAFDIAYTDKQLMQTRLV